MQRVVLIRCQDWILQVLSLFRFSRMQRQRLFMVQELVMVLSLSLRRRVSPGVRRLASMCHSLFHGCQAHLCRPWERVSVTLLCVWQRAREVHIMTISQTNWFIHILIRIPTVGMQITMVHTTICGVMVRCWIQTAVCRVLHRTHLIPSIITEQTGGSMLSV